MKTTVVKPLGLITQPNKYGSYPDGALQRATNVHMRNPGCIDNLPLPEVYRANAGGTNQIFDRIWAGPSKLLAASYDRIATAELRWITGAASSTIDFTEYGGFPIYTTPNELSFIQNRGRFYIGTEKGVFAMASEGAANAYLAGFPPPQKISRQATISTDAQAVDGQRTVAYRAIFVRKSTTGEFIKIGPPGNSLRFSNANAGGTFRDYTIRVGFPTAVSLNLAVGDYVELYRTNSVPIADAETGDDYFLTRSQAITSTDISNLYVDITDSTPDAGLGAMLYTSEEGETAAKYPPPYITDMAIFKGHIFYVANKLTGNFIVRIPGTWGALSTAAEIAHGIGSRTPTGDTTNTSTVLTNITSTTGVVAGQAIEGTGIPASTTVVSKTANTITMSAAATATNTGITISITDMIEIDGIKTKTSLAINLISALVASQTANVLVDVQLQDINAIGAIITILKPWYRYGIPTLRATNGANYDPPLPEIGETAAVGTQDIKLNRLRISEEGQPEAVTVVAGSELLVGSGEIYHIVSTTDALWCFCSDGLFRVSGEFPDWRVDPVDPTLIIGSRGGADQLQGVVWAQTSRGIVAIHQSGEIEEISNGVIDDISPGIVFSETWSGNVICDDANNEIHVITIDGSNTATAYIFNTTTRAFTYTTYERAGDLYSTAHAYVPFLRATVWGAHQSGSNDDIIRSGAATNTQMANANVIFQPFTGDGDPTTLKDFIDVTYLFKTAATGFTALPSFNGTSFPTGIVVVIPYSSTRPEGRGLASVPSEIATEEVKVSTNIAPGFTIASVGSDASWSFRGLSVRWVPAAEESL